MYSKCQFFGSIKHRSRSRPREGLPKEGTLSLRAEVGVESKWIWVEKPLYTAGGNVKRRSHLGKVWKFLERVNTE